MKYKGINRFYWQIGWINIFEDWTRLEYKIFVFRFFFLFKRPPEGERLKFWRDYVGINYESRE